MIEGILEASNPSEILERLHREGKITDAELLVLKGITRLECGDNTSWIVCDTDRYYQSPLDNSSSRD